MCWARCRMRSLGGSCELMWNDGDRSVSFPRRDTSESRRDAARLRGHYHTVSALPAELLLLTEALRQR